MVRTTYSEHEIGIVLQSGLFDESHYRNVSGQEGLSLSELVIHYLAIGWLQELDPSLSFIQKPYLVAYPDVIKARINPLFHYLTSGKAEGRTIYMECPAAWPKMPQKPDLPSVLSTWRPSISVDGKTTLILIVGGSDAEISATLTSIGDVGKTVDILRFTPSGQEDINTEIVRSITEHTSVPGGYEEIAILSGGDLPQLGWLSLLQEERLKFSTLAVGSEQIFAEGNFRISGYRITREGYVRPIERGIGAPICAQSLPVHLVSLRGALVDVDKLRTLGSANEELFKNSIWANLCMEGWFSGHSCRVVVNALVKQLDSVTSTSPLKQIRIRIPEQLTISPEWFVSSERTNEHGTQRVRLLGNLQGDLMGNPLALAAISTVEEFGMNLVVAPNPHKKEVEETTVGDVLVTTSYEVRHTERPGIRGRRQVEFVVEGVCHCQKSMCESPAFLTNVAKSKRHAGINEYWNLRRLITVSCGNDNQAQSRAVLRMGLLAIGFRPTAIPIMNHGAEHG
jgi:hypothetical protein